MRLIDADKLDMSVKVDGDRTLSPISQLIAQTIIQNAQTIQSDEDCISRECVLEHQRIVVDDDGIMLPVVDVSIVKKVPSIQSKAKMGHWIYRVVGIYRYASCSECNKMQVDESNYCPNCGARMEENEQGLAYTDQDTLQSAT